jgi:hypothetical protein
MEAIAAHALVASGLPGVPVAVWPVGATGRARAKIPTASCGEVSAI